ncbi:MAG: hypothetical protein WAV47_25915, partial [Blastocatellia bacterium]
EPKLAGHRGFLFVFVVRQRITRENGDECLFQFEPVFTTADGRVDNESLALAVTGTAVEERGNETEVPDAQIAFAAAQHDVEQRLQLWDWTDDVEFLALSWVEFV